MEAVLFIIFMTAAMGFGLWVPVLLPLAMGGVSLFLGLLVVRRVLGRLHDGGRFYPVIVGVLAVLFLSSALCFSLAFPAGFEGELFFRDIVPLPVCFR